MRPAPLHAEIARAPEGGAAHWLTASDGLRLRLAVWSAGGRGTVLILPGRTEYIEKYGPAAGEFAARGYATAVLDWRGQGLSDRLLEDGETGHVLRFADYQRDLDAAFAALAAMGLPQPWFLLAHSMGGCPGLRALMRGVPVRRAVFSAPMWGIRLAAALRPVAWALAMGARGIGQGHRYAPGTGPVNYVALAEFAGNVLTSDPEMYAFMRGQIAAQPSLALGGPSLHWVHEALRETAALRRLPSPAVPALTVLGSRERVVDPRPIRDRMAHWPGGRLDLVEGAEHEVMMEAEPIRSAFYDSAAAWFAGAGDRAASA